MKIKNLMALAILAASGASMAQVTLYGVVDLAYGTTNAPGANSSTAMQGNNAFNDGNSRWGIKEVEDLGGGMKFTAQFEQNINYLTGAIGAVNGRYAYGALSGNFGSFRFGRTLSPTFFGIAAWELTSVANFSAVANQFAFVGSSGRNDGQFSYTTPDLGGFTATLGYVAEQNNGINIATGAPASSKVDANAIYAGGPLTVALSYWKLDRVAVGASTDGNYALGAKYDFGSFTVAGSYQDPAGTSQGWTLGARVPVGQWAFTVDIAQDTGYDDTNYLVYAGYSLSKRTTIYANYQRDGKSNKKDNLGGVKTAQDIDLYGIGIRHNF
jgi:predicted porin